MQRMFDGSRFVPLNDSMHLTNILYSFLLNIIEYHFNYEEKGRVIRAISAMSTSSILKIFYIAF
uniref:Nudix hydrolase domain-containing protein n=1 Tax=Parascaris univalens TaxID=6257 RepID=A0A915BV82_PARUN